MKKQSEICAVVVTYNRRDKLKKCIECLCDQKGSSCDVLVVDNASTDDTEKMIHESFCGENLLYFNTGANLGGAGGFEFGINKAVKLGYDYVWIMDDDTWPEETALASLIDAGKEVSGKWGFLSSVAYWTDESICRMNIQKKDIFRHVKNDAYLGYVTPIKMCSFVSLFVKSSVIKEVGLPIGEYFIWTDDYEFTGRISREYPCYMVPGSKVVHAMEKHTRVNFATDSSDRLERYKYIYRNDVHCYRQYGLKGWIYIVLKDGYTILNILIHSKNKRFEKIKILFRGFTSGLKFYPEIKKVE